MLLVLIFSVLLAGLSYLLAPNPLLCSTTLSTGLASGHPHAYYALALIPFFLALRGRYARFVLLAPTIVSAAMAPEIAVSLLVASVVLELRRYRAWLVFVLIATAILLMVLVGVPIAALVVLALLVPATEMITDERWRVRAIVGWFMLAVPIVALVSARVHAFDLSVVGYTAPFPLAPALFTFVAVQAALTLDRDRHAMIFRSLFLLLGMLAFGALAPFVVVFVVGILAASVEQRMSEEGLRGVRVLAAALVVIALVPLVLHARTTESLQVDRAIVLTPDYFALACDGHAYPARLDASDELASIRSIREPGSISQALYTRSLTTIVYPEHYDYPVSFAVERNNVFNITRSDGLIVASLPSTDPRG